MKKVLVPKVKPGIVASEIQLPLPIRYSYAVIAAPPLSADSLNVTPRDAAPAVMETISGALGVVTGLPDSRLALP